MTVDAGGMLYKSAWSLDITQLGQFPTATVGLDSFILPTATTMPDAGASSASKTGSPPRTSSTSHTTVKPTSEGEESSSNDREKMSEYVAFVDAQAEECYERLKNEVERASRGA
ncbi:hypothetical protein MBLNU13_g09785t1 [Cladosporium sp. NU13]